MSVNLKTWLFHSSSFCWCIPVRAGFALMSVLTLVLSGGISVIIWFQISHFHQPSTRARVAFVLTGIFESVLFLASTIGFIGVVARKQLFVMTFSYFLYVHFVLNLIVGAYFLVTVRANNRQQLVDYCAQVFVDTSTESSCAKLTNVSTYVFIGIVAALLLMELYGALIAARYVYLLRMQKRDDRSRRLGYFHALSKPQTAGAKHTRQGSDNIELLRSRESTGDPPEVEDAVLDIGTRGYLEASTYERDLPLTPGYGGSPVSKPRSLSDTGSGRQIRALPPRPSSKLGSSVVQQSRWRERRISDSEDEPEEAEVSTNAHSALMDHASYMESYLRSLR